MSSFIGDSIVCGYNLQFDLRFLRRDYKKLGQKFRIKKVIDLLPVVRRHDSFLDDYKLKTALEKYSIVNTEPHNALSDAQATLKLFQKFIEEGIVKL